jgi:site-specific recombinase XerD
MLGYWWHDLRHSAVSRLIEQGADIAVVQAIAGHASAATTLKIYTHLRDQRLREAADRFDPRHVRGTTAPAGSR